MSLTIPIIAADGAQSVVTLADAVVGTPTGTIQSPTDLTAAVWSKGGVTVSKAADGSSLVIEDTSTGNHAVGQDFSNSGDQTYVITAEVNSAGRNLFALVSGGGAAAYTGFILTAPGSEQSFGAWGAGLSLVAHSIQSIDAGFFRVSYTVAVVASITALNVKLFLMNEFNLEEYPGAGVLGIKVRRIDVTRQVVIPPVVVPPGTFFVSAAGNDTNDGLSDATAWKTIDGVMAHAFAPGSQILLRRRDTFIGNLTPVIVGGGDPANPIVIGTYPQPALFDFANYAILTPAFSGGVGQNGTGIINGNGVSGVTIQDLVICAPDLTKQPRGGIRIASGGYASGWIIQRCEIWGIRFNSQTSPDWGALIMCEGVLGTMLVKNCYLHGEAGPESLTDAGIAGFGGSSTNPGFVTVVGNIVCNIGSAGALSKNFRSDGTRVVYPPLGCGIVTTGCPGGGLAEFNIVHDCGGNYNNAGGGPCSFMSTETDSFVWRFNEGYHCQPLVASVMADFVTIDLDNATTRSTAEFNYSHDNFNSGFQIFDRTGRNDQNTLRKNLSVNDGKAGMTGFMPFNVDTGGVVHVDDNFSFNDLVYTGVPYQQSQLQTSSGFVVIKNGFVTGTINNNIGVMGQGIYNIWNPVNSRDSTPAGLAISGNQWFGINGGSLGFWWGTTLYPDLASWQLASGKGPNTATWGYSGTVFRTYGLVLTAAERTLCVSALQAVLNLPGIDYGNSETDQPLPGDRMASMIMRFMAGDSPVTLPEFIALGFALTRAETTAGADTLLTRIKAIVLAT